MRLYKKAAGWLALVLVVLGVCSTVHGATEKWRVPSVVMSEATARGRVVILESRREDRRTIEGLRVQVRDLDDKLLHKTTTDDDGFFALPALPAGRYLIVIGELKMLLLVQEKTSEPASAAEPKILLIMLPKDVV